jgi:hypothetical protein
MFAVSVGVVFGFLLEFSSFGLSPILSFCFSLFVATSTLT